MLSSMFILSIVKNPQGSTKLVRLVGFYLFLTFVEQPEMSSSLYFYYFICFYIIAFNGVHSVLPVEGEECEPLRGEKMVSFASLGERGSFIIALFHFKVHMKLT